MPALGVYARLVQWKNNYYYGATVITMREEQQLVETFILDFSCDLYQETITVYFCAFIRHYEHFTTITALIAVINSDILQVRNYFTSNSQIIEQIKA